MKKNLDKFIKTGSVKDYLEYKRAQREAVEHSKELTSGETNDSKRGNNS